MQRELSPLEGQRIVAILNEAILKLEVLGAMAPDIRNGHKVETTQLVNDEISRTIEDQRELQARYEELINQRSQLKSVSNKAKHKEIQTEIEEVAASLKYATKVLCRNLQENPSAADNVLKVLLRLYFLISRFKMKSQGCGKYSLRQWMKSTERELSERL